QHYLVNGVVLIGASSSGNSRVPVEHKRKQGQCEPQRHVLEYVRPLSSFPSASSAANHPTVVLKSTGDMSVAMSVPGCQQQIEAGRCDSHNKQREQYRGERETAA
ncbi:hypothetical protein EIP86_000176, partial [Pleurotus ostreatoroseus]